MNDYLPGAIWPAEDEKSVQIREVYARYGLAMYQAQVLEHGIVNAIVVALVLPTAQHYPSQMLWEEAVDRAFDAQLAKTFGKMLEALQPLGLPDDVMARLRIAKVERDRLAHRFFREHDQSFLSSAGREKMIAECEDAIERLIAIDADLERLIGPLRERYHISDDWIESRVAAMRAAAEADE